MSDKDAKKREKAESKALKAEAKAQKKADKQAEKEAKKKGKTGFFTTKRSNSGASPLSGSANSVGVNNSPSPRMVAALGNGKVLSSLERALMMRPGEQDLIAKGIIKSTRNIPVFGVPLPHVMYITYTQFQLPLPVLHAAAYLRKDDNLKTEGIFRVPGSAEEVNAFKAKYNIGEDPEFGPSHIHSVASMLKLYFRELKEPLCTFKGYSLFCDSQRETDPELSKKKLMSALASLPPVNRALFGTVVRLLKDVAKHDKVNFMSPDNLGIVWGPTLLREEKENFMSMDLPVAVIIALIKHCDELFAGEEQLELKGASQTIILHNAPPAPPPEISDSGTHNIVHNKSPQSSGDLTSSGAYEAVPPPMMLPPPAFPRLPDFGVQLRTSSGADSDRGGRSPFAGRSVARSSSFSARNGEPGPPGIAPGSPAGVSVSGSYPVIPSRTETTAGPPPSPIFPPIEPPARIYTPPMLPSLGSGQLRKATPTATDVFNSGTARLHTRGESGEHDYRPHE